MKNCKGKIDGNFVPLMLDTIDAPAWRALSHGARSLYVALKRRYNRTIENNGRIYLPTRIAAIELGSKRGQIIRWFRELQYYGFIVMVTAGYLGVEGRGRAPCWRLTELAYRGKPPTREFAHWNRPPFKGPKTKSRSPKGDHGGPQKGTKGPLVPKRAPRPLVPKRESEERRWVTRLC